LWEKSLSSINIEISVNSGINNVLNSVSNSADDNWENGTLDEWDEYSGDLGNKSSGKFNINVFWVNGDISLLDSELWCDII
jgi:hypothetical protein